MIMTSVQIQNPHRYTTVVVPFNKGETFRSQGYALENPADGEIVEAQGDIVARHADGSVQALQLTAVFTVAPLWVNILDAADNPATVRLSRFKWTPTSREALAHMKDMYGNGVLVVGGPVVQVYRYDGHNSKVWLTVWTGCDEFRLDGIMHNAIKGSPETLIPGWEFFNKHLVWNYSELMDQDLFQQPTIDSNAKYYFPQRSRRIVRCTVRKVSAGDWTEAPTHLQGVGICTQGWASKRAWTAAAITCPAVPSTVVARIHSDMFRARDALSKNLGYPYPSYIHSEDIGCWHPSWSFEGGQTGGSGITQAMGSEVPASGMIAGIERAYLEQRMLTDRHHVGLLEPDGKVCRVQDYRKYPGWSMSAADANFDKGGGYVKDGPFEFSAQPDLDPTEVPERAKLDKFEPMDWAHLVRFLQPCVVLVYLTNDHLSRHLILQEAQNARMSMDNGRVTSDLSLVSQNPEQGIHYSRIQGWQMTAMAEAHAVCNDSVRADMTETLNKMVEVCRRAEMFSGLINVDRNGKEFHKPPYSGQYGVSVCIQHGLLAGGLYRACRVLGQPFYFHAENGVEWLLSGSQTVWSGASIPATFQGPDGGEAYFVTRQIDSLSPPYPGAPSLDSEQTRAVLAWVGFRALETNDLYLRGKVNSLLFRMLGSTPKQALLAMGPNLADSDLVVYSYCVEAGLP